MADLLFVVITIVFFVVCVGYVRVCDRIIGGDPRATGDSTGADDDRELVREVVGS
jgi:hypothetical protein